MGLEGLIIFGADSFFPDVPVYLHGRERIRCRSYYPAIRGQRFPISGRILGVAVHALSEDMRLDI
jgi:hypothetical protein